MHQLTVSYVQFVERGAALNNTWGSTWPNTQERKTTNAGFPVEWLSEGLVPGATMNWSTKESRDGSVTCVKRSSPSMTSWSTTSKDTLVKRTTSALTVIWASLNQQGWENTSACSSSISVKSRTGYSNYMTCLYKSSIDQNSLSIKILHHTIHKLSSEGLMQTVTAKMLPCFINCYAKFLSQTRSSA